MMDNRLPVPKAAKFLLTDRCNLACSFCHNEFQGDVDLSARNKGFEVDRVKTILGTDRYTIVKLSGGEPLLYPMECTSLLRIAVTNHHLLQRVLISNLAANWTAQTQAVFDAGVSEIRINLPTFDRDRYARMMRKNRLTIAMRNAERAARCCTVRLQKVYTPDCETTDDVKTYIEKAAALGFASSVAVLIDARSNAIDTAFQAIVLSLGGKPRNEAYFGRIARLTFGQMQISVIRCSSWDPELDIESETDDYFVPPGLKMLRFVPGRAYRWTGEKNDRN